MNVAYWDRLSPVMSPPSPRPGGLLKSGRNVEGTAGRNHLLPGSSLAFLGTGLPVTRHGMGACYPK